MTTEHQSNEFIERFAKLASNSSIWLRTARRLYVSARVLAGEIHRRWNDFGLGESAQRRLVEDDFDVVDCQPAYMMLMALALENVFKARLVRDNSSRYRQLIVESGALPKELRTHDLRGLAQRCGVHIDGSVAAQLDRLSKFSVWRGRYHFPLRFDTFYHLSSLNDVPSSGIAFSSSDVDDLMRLVESISEKLGLDIARTARPRTP